MMQTDVGHDHVQNGMDSIRHEWLVRKWIQCTDHVGNNAKERQSAPKQLGENNQDNIKQQEWKVKK